MFRPHTSGSYAGGVYICSKMQIYIGYGYPQCWLRGGNKEWGWVGVPSSLSRLMTQCPWTVGRAARRGGTEQLWAARDSKAAINRPTSQNTAETGRAPLDPRAPRPVISARHAVIAAAVFTENLVDRRALFGKNINSISGAALSRRRIATLRGVEGLKREEGLSGWGTDGRRRKDIATQSQWLPPPDVGNATDKNLDTDSICRVVRKGS